VHRLRPRRQLRFRPATRLGLNSVRLVGLGVLVTWSCSTLIAATDYRPPLFVAPILALAGLLAIIVGGSLALVAIAKQRERSVAAWATIPFWAAALLLVVGELLIPH